MSDCPHHPGLKRLSATFSRDLSLEPSAHAVHTLMIRPEDCVQCAMARIKALRGALLDMALLARQLMRHPSPITAADASGRLTAAFEVHMHDVRNWYDP